MDVLGKLMQQICSTSEAGWLLLSRESSEFPLKLQGDEMQCNMLIFNVKNADNIFFKLTYLSLISSVGKHGKNPIKPF